LQIAGDDLSPASSILLRGPDVTHCLPESRFGSPKARALRKKACQRKRTLQSAFTDEFEFSILSPSAGLTVNPRQYHRFSEAAQEVVEVRILQGIHFRFADEQARRQGRRVAHWTFKKVLKPLPGTQ